MSASRAASRSVLVTGGSGFVGGRIARAIAEAGHSVRVLARDPDAAARTLSGSDVGIAAGEILDGDGLVRAMQGVDTVVHAAATYSYDRRAAHRMVEENPRLSERVFATAAAHGVRLVVDVSSGIVFRGHGSGRLASVTDADSPLWDAADREWADPYLRSKVLGEQVARRYAADGLPMTSLHPVNTVGPGDRGPGVSGAILLRLVRPFAVLPDARSAWVDVRDVATAAVAAIGRPPGGRHLLAAVSEPWCATAQRLDALTGSKRRRLWLPPRVVRALTRVNERAGGRLARELPPSVEFALTLGDVDGASGLPALGLAYRPFESTLRETLEWWTANAVVPPRIAGLAGER